MSYTNHDNDEHDAPPAWEYTVMAIALALLWAAALVLCALGTGGTS